MSITVSNTTSTSSSPLTIPTRIGSRSRPGWRQTAVRFRAQVTTTVFAPPAPLPAPVTPAGPEQLTLFDPSAYDRKAVVR